MISFLNNKHCKLIHIETEITCNISMNALKIILMEIQNNKQSFKQYFKRM